MQPSCSLQPLERCAHAPSASRACASASPRCIAAPRHFSSCSHRAIAAAAAATGSAAFSSAAARYPPDDIGILPPPPPTAERRRRLINKSLTLNPLDGLTRVVEASGFRINIAFAAAVDRHPAATAAAIAGAAAAAALGADPVSLAHRGVSEPLCRLLETAFGFQPEWLQKAIAGAICSLPCAYALRGWWAASTAGLAPPLAAFCAAKLDAPGAAPALSYLLTATRLAALYLTYDTLAAMASGAASGAAAACAAATYAVSYALLALPGAPAAAAAGGAALPLAAALEASWLAAAAAAAGLGGAGIAAAAALAAAHGVVLAALSRLFLAGRFRPHQAAPGDAVRVHVTASTHNAAVFADTRRNGEPMALTACAASSGAAAASTIATTSPPSSVSTAGAAAGAAAPGAASPQACDLGAKQPQRGLEFFAPAIAAAAIGMYVGEKRRVEVANPPAGGYYDPALCWWQPRADFVAKLKREPSAGEVFWYPIADGSWLQVAVTSVGPRYVEMDANFGLAGRPLALDVTLQALNHVAA